jgi:HK97 family phage prohead protease
MTFRHDHGAVVEIEEKALQETEGCWTFTGYSSIFGTKDLGNDIVVAGAFAKSLRENGLPLLLFQHKMEDAPIGTIVDAKEDKRGLWVKGELPKDDTFVSGRIVPQLKRRGLKGMSIGYKATQSERDKESGCRLLKQIRLFECSFVSLPMHPDAGLESIKGIVPFQDLRIDKMAKSWDGMAALKRLQEKFGDGERSEIRQAFLYADEEKSAAEWDTRLLIADVDEKGILTVNPIALYKACAAIAGARRGVADSVTLPEDAGAAIEAHLERYYSRLNLEPPFKSFSVDEFDALDPGEREARLRGIGISRKLAIRLSAQRDAERDPIQRDAGSSKEVSDFLTALRELAAAGRST